jgi:hypothetical protein
MNEKPEQPDPGEDRLRRLLRRSRKVVASADFEERLLRRLGKESSTPRTARTLFPGRMPAYAYSLLAVAVVGMLSYYMFLRPPKPPAEGTPNAPIRDAIRNDQVQTGTPSGGSLRNEVESRSSAKEHPLPATTSGAATSVAGTTGPQVKRGSSTVLEKKMDTNVAVPAEPAPSVSAPTMSSQALSKMKSFRPGATSSGMTLDSSKRLDSLNSDSLRAHPDSTRFLRAPKPRRP